MLWRGKNLFKNITYNNLEDNKYTQWINDHEEAGVLIKMLKTLVSSF